MPRLRLIALATVAALSVSAAAALAQDDSPAPSSTAAVTTATQHVNDLGSVPKHLPALVPGFQGTYAYQAASDALTHPTPVHPPHGGSGTAVVVTARVAKARTLVVSPHGRLLHLYSNTDDPRVRPSVYTVRIGSTDGSPGTLTPALWAQTLAVMGSSSTVIGQLL